MREFIRNLSYLYADFCWTFNWTSFGLVKL